MMNVTRLMRVVAARVRGRGKPAPSASLWRDQSGGTTMLVAFAVPVFVGGLGLGVDVSAWYMEKHRVQQQADAAALGAARMLASGQSSANAKAAGIRDAQRNGYTAATGTSIVVNTPPTSGTYAGKTGAAEAIVTKQLPSLFSRFLLGSTAKSVSGRAVGYTPPVQKKNLEVSMALDVTGSMLGLTELLGMDKLTAMKNSAKELVDIVIQTRQAPFTSRVALAPFSAAVNVGSEYFNDVTNKSLSGSWSSVVERSGTNKFTDEPPSTANGWFRDYKTERSDAHGAQGLNQAYQNSNIPSGSVIVPLTNNKDTIKAGIEALQAKGSTAGHIGLAWAWYQLSPKWNQIFTGSAAPTAYNTANTYKALVMMSDFDFNVYYVSGNGDADTQFAQLCTNAKNAGVVIFVVGYKVATTADTNTMRNCASGSDKVYSVDNVDEMLEAFRAIAAQTVAGASEPTLRIVE